MNSLLFAALVDFVLVLSLGSDDYTTRTQAEEQLGQRGWKAHVVLRQGMQAEDTETRNRCANLYAVALDNHLLTFCPIPEIDAAWYDVERRGYYSPTHSEEHPVYTPRYARMRPFIDRIGADGWPWRNYYLATVDWLRWELENGTDEDELRALLNEMRWRDSAFLHGTQPPKMIHSDD